MRVATFLTMLAVCVVGCGGGSTQGGAELSVYTDALSSASVTQVSITISGSELSKPLVQSLTKVGASWQGTIRAIPVGSDYTFVGAAFDATGALVYQSSLSPVTISRGATTTVAMLLQQVTPSTPFDNAVPVIDGVIASTNAPGIGEGVNVQVLAHDPNGSDVLTIGWQATGGSFGNAAAASTTWTAPSTTGPETVTVNVTDQKGGTNAISFTVNVTPGRGNAGVSTTFNTWPIVSSLIAAPGRLDVGQSASLALVASDADGDALSYQWSTTCNGSFSNPQVANPQFTLAQLAPSGSCALVVVVSDGRGGSTHGSLSIQTGPGVAANFAPVVDSAYQSSVGVAGRQPVTLSITAHDPDGTPVTIAWAANTGVLGTPSLLAPGTSQVQWTAPACFDASVTPTIAATITDATGVSTTFAFPVTPTGTTCPPPSAWCAGVVNPTQLLGLEVRGGPVNFALGASVSPVPLTAVAYYRSNPSQAVDVTSQVQWATSDATRVSVAGGAVAPVSGTTAGKATITATLQSLSASTVVRLWDPAELATLSALSISGVPSNMSSGDCAEAQAVATFGSTTEDVTDTVAWTTGGRGAMVGNDLFAAVGTAGEGYFSLSATLTVVGNSATQSTSQTVGIWGPMFNGHCADPRVPGTLWGVSVPSASLYVGEAKSFVATGIYSDHSQRDISDLVTWQSCNYSQLDVTADGWASALASGSTTLVATLGTAGGSTSLSASPAPALGSLTSLQLAPSAANIPVGSGYRMLALASYSAVSGHLMDVTSAATWTSSAPAIADVSYGAGTGASIGRTLVSASLGTQTATGAVRVWDPARLASITSIAVSWPSSNITGEQCEQLQLIATFNGSSSDTEDCANSAIWSLIGPGNIDANGLFTSAPMNGYVTITGSLGRGIQRPVSGEIGVWGSGGTCSP